MDKPHLVREINKWVEISIKDSNLTDKPNTFIVGLSPELAIRAYIKEEFLDKDLKEINKELESLLVALLYRKLGIETIYSPEIHLYDKNIEVPTT